MHERVIIIRKILEEKDGRLRFEVSHVPKAGDGAPGKGGFEDARGWVHRLPHLKIEM
jgi:hypothetical protein